MAMSFCLNGVATVSAGKGGACKPYLKMAYADSYRMAKNPVSAKSGAAIISVSFSYEFPYQRRIRLKNKISY